MLGADCRIVPRHRRMDLALQSFGLHRGLRIYLYGMTAREVMQATKAKGAILVHSRQPLVIDEFDLPETLLPGHVLVKIHCTSICGAQINEIDAVKGIDKFLPHLLGHEASGTVIEVGPGVTTKKPGDAVVLHGRPSQEIQSAPPAY